MTKTGIVDTAVCTLFEGSYHRGVAALANSLCRKSYRGRILAGFRGRLPPWAASARGVPVEPWADARVLPVADGVELVFLPLHTDHHLTNHKPFFMQALWDGPARHLDALFYLDPDICVVREWSFFEQWVDCGVALCEDLNSPLSRDHPRRVGWRRFYGPRGLALSFRHAEYVNGGFVGVHRRDRPFLDAWCTAMQLMAEEIGSLAAASIQAGATCRSKGFADCFDTTDQDGLNAAIEASTVPVSVIGQEAMGFKPGAALLPHAVGAGKPWQRNYLLGALRGVAPRLADKAFWAHAASPIAVAGGPARAWKSFDIAAAAAVGRVVRRS